MIQEDLVAAVCWVTEGKGVRFLLVHVTQLKVVY